MGATRDFEALETRRREGAKLLRSGVSQAEVARRLNVSRMAVTKWNAILSDEGLKGLRKAEHVGRQPRLNKEFKMRLVNILKKGALIAGFGVRWQSDTDVAIEGPSPASAQAAVLAR